MAKTLLQLLGLIYVIGLVQCAYENIVQWREKRRWKKQKEA